ncbi:hypothetical protein [Parachlamydia sp. AcF125]|uniref:hypothetical protein n=1 Tax=Parachlamydia sp. AcF125 TaxID=2795736 RepID=UPI001BC9E619|nr:hypothetical protein [Parachlamydia sp. AcF125]MBS4167929.1 hypothetical protein [Parachlamydia sp. AcF125]
MNVEFSLINKFPKSANIKSNEASFSTFFINSFVSQTALQAANKPRKVTSIKCFFTRIVRKIVKFFEKFMSALIRTVKKPFKKRAVFVIPTPPPSPALPAIKKTSNQLKGQASHLASPSLAQASAPAPNFPHKPSPSFATPTNKDLQNFLVKKDSNKSLTLRNLVEAKDSIPLKSSGEEASSEGLTVRQKIAKLNGAHTPLLETKPQPPKSVSQAAKREENLQQIPISVGPDEALPPKIPLKASEEITPPVVKTNGKEAPTSEIWTNTDKPENGQVLMRSGAIDRVIFPTMQPTANGVISVKAGHMNPSLSSEFVKIGEYPEDHDHAESSLPEEIVFNRDKALKREADPVKMDKGSHSSGSTSPQSSPLAQEAERKGEEGQMRSLASSDFIDLAISSSENAKPATNGKTDFAAMKAAQVWNQKGQMKALKEEDVKANKTQEALKASSPAPIQGTTLQKGARDRIKADLEKFLSPKPNICMTPERPACSTPNPSLYDLPLTWETPLKENGSSKLRKGVLWPEGNPIAQLNSPVKTDDILFAYGSKSSESNPGDSPVLSRINSPNKLVHLTKDRPVRPTRSPSKKMVKKDAFPEA